MQTINSINTDALSIIIRNLDVESINALYSTSKTINQTIKNNSRFFYDICQHKQPHGKMEEWWDINKTQLKSSYNCKDGNLHGEYKTWYSNGQLEYLCNYSHGKITGFSTKWTVFGRIKEMNYYSYNPRKVCNTVLWHDGGGGVSYTKINQNLHGKYEQWDCHGSLVFYAEYKNGHLHGKLKKYHYNGTLYSESQYVDSIKNGTEYVWDENGILKSHTKYHNGEKHGNITEWHPTGKLSCEGYYEVGNLKYLKTYDENGVLKHTITDGIYNGQIVHHHELYHENGKLSMKYMITQKGFLEGEEYIWSDTGEILEKNMYRSGVGFCTTCDEIFNFCRCR